MDKTVYLKKFKLIGILILILLTYYVYFLGKQNIELNFANKQLSDSLLDMQKLSQIDPELLKKYSKNYFLNENYTPRDLIQVDINAFLADQNRKVMFLTQAYPFLIRMVSDNHAFGGSLQINYGYRSFVEQRGLKNNLIGLYGENEANSIAAEPGLSEHQLGTAVDFGSKGTANFEKSGDFNWLQNNAYKYGFVMSYPENNSYYSYEPWHWRFVGVALATYLYSEKKYLYELDQREIDKYLINIFDQS